MDKNIVIYRKERGRKSPQVGDLSDVRVGDAVHYEDMERAHAVGRIEKVNLKAGILRLAAAMYEQYVLRPARSLKFDQILVLERPNPEVAGNPQPELMIMEMFREPVPEAPVPTKKAKPVYNK